MDPLLFIIPVELAGFAWAFRALHVAGRQRDAISLCGPLDIFDRLHVLTRLTRISLIQHAWHVFTLRDPMRLYGERVAAILASDDAFHKFANEAPE